MAFDRKKANQQKTSIQDNAVTYFQKYRKLLLEWATGCGKSLASLKMIKSYYDINPDIKGYLICKEQSHIGNWEAEIKAHGMDFMDNCCTKFLYDSLHKYNGPVDFVILDECHALTEKRLEELLRITNVDTAIIPLSATVNEYKLELLRALCRNLMVTSTITISDAIKQGILPPPKVYVHFYNLEDSVANQEYIVKKGNPQTKAITCTYYDAGIHLKKKNVKLKVKCTEKQAYELISADMNVQKQAYINNRSAWARKKWANLGSARKRMMAEMKTQRAIDLISSELKGYRFICFTGSKKQCEKIGKKEFIHSDLKSKEVNDKRIAFNDGDIDELYVVNMFRESVNLFNVQKGLVIQLDNVKLTFIQMLGRVFRSDFPEMHIMVFKDTQDEKYYDNIIKGFNKEYIIKINH